MRGALATARTRRKTSWSLSNLVPARRNKRLDSAAGSWILPGRCREWPPEEPNLVAQAESMHPAAATSREKPSCQVQTHGRPICSRAGRVESKAASSETFRKHMHAAPIEEDMHRSPAALKKREQHAKKTGFAWQCCWCHFNAALPDKPRVLAGNRLQLKETSGLLHCTARRQRRGVVWWPVTRAWARRSGALSAPERKTKPLCPVSRS